MELIMIGVFIASSLLGYIVIKKVPSLLHTPLMSGMNALSGITVIGALTATAVTKSPIAASAAGLAVILAIINVAGGFSVTHRMLRMFSKKESRDE
ncbi:MAG: NAD(P) transhydrogenase subunit alpha [Oscillospiraceae bacterium]